MERIRDFCRYQCRTIEDLSRGCENPRFAARCQTSDPNRDYPANINENSTQTSESRFSMGTSRRITESQLERAKAALAAHVKVLQEAGVEKKDFPSDPRWRKLDARVRQINLR